MIDSIPICRWCGEDYLPGLYPAHLLIAHSQPRPKDPNRIFTCPHCGAKYPASERSTHLTSIEHREWHLLNVSFDPIPVAEAYIRGDRLRDIEDAFPDLHTKDIYLALRICGVEKRGNPIRPIVEVGQRDYLARTVGDRWERIRRLREQGKSWLQIEQVMTG